jgi:DNA-binding transcriptional regulator WhiA
MKTNMEILRSVPKETFEQYIENNMSRQEIADIFGMERRSIDRILSELGLTTHGHLYGMTKIEETIFDVIDTEEKSYWAGFLFADGCVSDKAASGLSLKLKLAAQDKDHLIKFKNFLKDIRDDETSVRPETAKKDGKEYLQYYYLTYNKHLINSLIKM